MNNKNNNIMKLILRSLLILLTAATAHAQVSRVHVKSRTGANYSISAEAPVNNKLIGISHDGSAGTISTGTLDGSTNFSPLRFATGGQPRLAILENGFVGIGTLTPTVELTVAGKVHARELKVNVKAGTAPDYVFQPTYELPSLSYVAGYINQHRHLPNVPTATEMENEGVDVGEMNMLLLKKVEELTLYILEQDKQIKEINAKVESMQNEINSCAKK
jgi:hypothetical protein